MDDIMDDFKRTRSYDIPPVHFVEYINNGTGCWHYDAFIGDDDNGIGFDTTEQLSENLLTQIARIAEHAAKLYRFYGYNTAQADMRKALGIR